MRGHSWLRIAPVAALALLGAACADVRSPLGAEAGEAELARRAGAGTLAAHGSATIYVVHGINGGDLGLSTALPVDVSVNGGCALTDFEFGDIAGPLSLPAGTYAVAVHLQDGDGACAGTAAVSGDIPFEGGKNYSVVAHLTDGGAPTASLFENDVQRNPGRSNVAVRHTADFGPVNIWVDGGVAFAGLENGAEGTAVLRPGEHEVAIQVPGGPVAFEANPVLRPFTFYAFYAVGTPAKGSFDVLVQTISIPATPN